MHVDSRGGARFRHWTAAASAAVLAVTGFAPAPAAAKQDEAAHIRGHVAGRIAHHICAGLFVVGRDYERSVEEVVAQDLEPFGDLPDGFDFAVDHDTRTASVSGDGFGTRSAVYNGDQGCTILPEGFEGVVFEPLVVERRGPDPETTAWPTGNVDAYHDPPPVGVDMATVEAALDDAMAQTGQHTRALVVVHAGKILGERYAGGFTRNTPQLSWPQGKSIAAALVGAAIEAGHLDVGLDDPAPVPSGWDRAPAATRRTCPGSSAG